MLELPILSYFLLYIVSIPNHDIDDHMETNNRKDRLNRLRLRSDDREDPYDRDDYMETRLYAFFHYCRQAQYNVCHSAVL